MLLQLGVGIGPRCSSPYPVVEGADECWLTFCNANLFTMQIFLANAPTFRYNSAYMSFRAERSVVEESRRIANRVVNGMSRLRST